jgi:hypothetical protein
MHWKMAVPDEDGVCFIPRAGAEAMPRLRTLAVASNSAPRVAIEPSENVREFASVAGKHDASENRTSARSLAKPPEI